MRKASHVDSVVLAVVVGVIVFISGALLAEPIITREPCGSCKRLFVSVIALNVKITSHNKPEVVAKFTKPEPKGDGGEFLSQMILQSNVTREVTEIRAKLPPHKSDWQKLVQTADLSTGQLEVLVPSTMALDLYVHTGDVSVQKWNAPINVNSQKGATTLNYVTGEVLVRSFLGPVRVENVKGPLTLESFSGSVKLENVTGRTKIRTFYGETQLKNIKGALNINSQLSPVVARSTHGPLEIHAGTSPIKILSHQGNVNAFSDAALVEVRTSSASKVRLKSESGSLIASVPSKMPSSVYLSSVKGDVRVPKNLEKSQNSTGRTVRGQLAGGGAGLVRLVSETGNVTLRTN